MAAKKQAAPKPKGQLQHFPQVGLLSYTLTQHSPFKDAYEVDWSQVLMATYNHREHYRQGGDPMHEDWHLHNTVTLWDVWVEKWTRVTGPDAAEFANMLTPRDLTKCKPGQGKYVFITNEQGGIVNDPVLYRLAEDDFLFTAADSDMDLAVQGFLSGLRAAGRDMDVHIDANDPSSGRPYGAMVQVQGPKSGDVLAELFGDDILTMGYYWLVEGSRDQNGKFVPRPNAKVWRKLTCLDGTVVDVFVARTGFSGLEGFEIGLYDAGRHGVSFWKTLLKTVNANGGMHIGPGHMQRIKGGFLSYGNDIARDGTTLPFHVLPEKDWKWAVPESKHSDYLGKQALQSARDKGIDRKLVSLDIKGDPLGTFTDGSMSRVWHVYNRDDVVWLPEETAQQSDGSYRTPDGEVYGDKDVFKLMLGKPKHIGRMYYVPETAVKIGDVTSASWNTAYETNIGLAMLPIEFSQPGTNVAVMTEWGLRDAMVHPIPFDNEKKVVPHTDLSQH